MINTNKKIDDKIAMLIQQEKEIVIKQDKEMKLKGYNYRYTYWKHKNSDDKQYDFYSKNKLSEIEKNKLSIDIEEIEIKTEIIS